MLNHSPTRQRIKQILVKSLSLEHLTPEKIGDDQPLWGDAGLGLDSVDALELMVALEKEYGFRIDTEEVDAAALATVTHLEGLVHRLRTSQGDAGPKAEEEISV